MHPSTTALLAALSLGCCAPAWAWDGWDGGPALRLPGEPGVQAWTGKPSLRFGGWVHDLSLRLAAIPRPSAALSAAQPPAERTVVAERSRGSLAVHWRPWVAGAWVFGATLGLHRSVPGSAASGVAAMPMASYEQPHYRVNLGLMPPHGDRSSALVLGLSLPLR